MEKITILFMLFFYVALIISIFSAGIAMLMGTHYNIVAGVAALILASFGTYMLIFAGKRL